MADPMQLRQPEPGEIPLSRHELAVARALGLFGRHPVPDIGLSDLLARTVEEGECLIWQGFALHGQFPQWRLFNICWPVRRLLWVMTRGPVLPRHQIGVTCGNPLCVHPDHLQSRTRSRAQKGKVLSVDRRARIAMARRAKSQLTMEMVREIRASTEPCTVLDKQYGLAKGYASRIRCGDVWADTSNPFAGLGARNA